MSKKTIYCLALFFCWFTSNGQSELNLPYLNSVYQASYSNPAAKPMHKFSLGLPGISSLYFGVTNTAFKYYDIERVKDTLNLNKIVHAAKKNNYIYTGVNTDLFHLRFQVKANYFLSFHVREMVDFRFAYPKDMAKFLIEGNGKYIGQTLDLSGLRLESTHYREYAVGFLKTNDKGPFTFGGRFKFLQGMSNVNMKYKDLKLTTDGDMYDLSSKPNGVLNTSIPFDIDSDSVDVDGNFINDYMTNFSNKGFAIDLGASYQYNEKLSFSAAMNNIGYIKWKQNARNYRIKGNSSFSGIDLIELEYEYDDAEDYLDSLSKDFNYYETSDSYTKWLTPQLYLTANYNLFEQTDLYATIYMEKYQTLRPAFTVAVSQKAARFLQAVVSYTYQYNNFSNLGAALVLKPGPVQFYIATDNLLALDYLGAKHANIRFGINIVAGKIRTPSKQPLSEDLN
jgi:hypothetical protein